VSLRKEPLGRTSGCGINVNLKEAGLDDVNFIYLPQKREK
jgi:hypothetical protein